MRTTRLAAGSTSLFTIAVMLSLGVPPAAAVVPGSNGMIAFETGRDGNEEIYVMNADGSGQTNLTNDPGFDAQPAWSPDGNRIAFSSDGEVAVMNADGSGQTNLTNAPSSDFDPTWSPDGSRIAFTTDRNGSFEVYVMYADGSGQTNLTNTPGVNDFGPAWSPDGSEIAFQTNRDGNVEVYVMNADGSNPTNLTRAPKTTDFDPAWSPDGSKLAFVSAGRDSEVFVMNADGSGPTNLTNTHSASDVNPAWSPDGTKIAFSSFRNNEYGIYVMAADGAGGIDQLTTGPDFNRAPDWQSIPSTAGADLVLGLAASPNAIPNQPLTYTITVENEGPSTATDVAVTDVLPSGAVFMSLAPGAGSCVAPPPRSTGTVVCTLEALAPGETLVVEITVRVVAKTGTITNAASATSSTPDPNGANNTASVTTTIG